MTLPQHYLHPPKHNGLDRNGESREGTTSPYSLAVLPQQHARWLLEPIAVLGDHNILDSFSYALDIAVNSVLE